MTSRDRFLVGVFVAMALSAVVASIVFATRLEHEPAAHLLACESVDEILLRPVGDDVRP